MEDIYSRHEARLRDAWKVAATDELGNPVTNSILPDGARVSVPMMLMDGKPVQIDDAERERQRQVLKDERDRVRAVWDAKVMASHGVHGSVLDISRSQLPAGHRNGSAPLTDAQATAREASLAAYCYRISNAWRNLQGGG